MFNMNGEVVGLNTYGFMRAENTAFAQPINILLDDLIAVATFGKKVRGHTGVHLKPFPLRDRKDVGFVWQNGYDDATGALVGDVDILTMFLTGIRKGDVVTSMDVMQGDKLIESYDVNYSNRYQDGLMKRKIYNQKAGMHVVYHVYRPKEGGGFEAEKLIKVPVIELPQDVYDAEGMKIFQRFMGGMK